MKVQVLTLIRDKKDVLFGKFSSRLTKKDKDKAWEEVGEEAKALGVIGQERDAAYLRDTTWQNWRKRALVGAYFFI